MDTAEFIAYHGKRGAALQSFGRASPGARPGQRLQRPEVWYEVDLSTWTFDYDRDVTVQGWWEEQGKHFKINQE